MDAASPFCTNQIGAATHVGSIVDAEPVEMFGTLQELVDQYEALSKRLRQYRSDFCSAPDKQKALMSFAPLYDKAAEEADQALSQMVEFHNKLIQMRWDLNAIGRGAPRNPWRDEREITVVTMLIGLMRPRAGVVVNRFRARFDHGKALIESDHLEEARRVLETARQMLEVDTCEELAHQLLQRKEFKDVLIKGGVAVD